MKIRKKTKKVRRAFIELGNVLNSIEIKSSTRLRIFNSNLKSVLLYGSVSCGVICTWKYYFILPLMRTTEQTNQWYRSALTLSHHCSYEKHCYLVKHTYSILWIVKSLNEGALLVGRSIAHWEFENLVSVLSVEEQAWPCHFSPFCFSISPCTDSLTLNAAQRILLLQRKRTFSFVSGLIVSTHDHQI